MFWEEMFMKKKMISLAMATVLSLSVSTSAWAASQGVVEKSVNFRTSPSTSSSIIGLLKAGTTFDLLEQVNSYWVKASVNGQTGYLSTNYISLSSNSASGQGVVQKSVNFRTSPSTSSSVISLLKAGTTFVLLEQVNSYWVKVSVNGQVGYLSTSYVSLSSGSGSSPPTEVPADTKADRIIARAKNLQGVTKYQYGVNKPPSQLDCSSFTKYVFGLEGVTLKWGTRYQKDAGSAVSKANLKKGDLVFFWTATKGTISHVGIYIGNGQFIHNAPSLNGVGISSLTSGYWNDHYVSARRVL